MTHQEWLRYAAKWQLDDEAECAALVGAEALDIAEALARHPQPVDDGFCVYCRCDVENRQSHHEWCLYSRAVKLMEDHRAE